MKIKLFISCLLMYTVGYTQIENGIIAQFNFNNNLIDESESFINANASNDASIFTEDRNASPNNCIEFSGSDYVEFTDTDIKISLPITISVWVYADVIDGSYPHIIFASDNVYNNYYGYALGINHSGEVNIRIAGGLGSSGPSNRRTFLTVPVITQGNWHHIVAIINDYEDMKVYVDCREVEGTYSGSGSTTIAYSDTESSIGWRHGHTIKPEGDFFDGKMDDLVIWNRTLSNEEINILCEDKYVLFLDEENLKNAVNIYPNPVNTILYIKANKDSNISRVSISNTFGQKLYDANYTEQINIESFPKGFYFINLYEDNKLLIETKKIIVE